jgi:hypothetical protein
VSNNASEKPETKEPLHVTLSSLLDAMNPSLPFVDDDAAGRRHHATSCLSRKTRASPIKIVQRSSKSGKVIFNTTYSHHLVRTIR